VSFSENMDHETPEPPFTLEQRRLALVARVAEKLERVLARGVVLNLQALRKVAAFGHRLCTLKLECRAEIVRLRCEAELALDPDLTEPGGP
jgi:hypothetical protein